ncbi:MAG: hypothetical protein KF779_02275 [Hyphomonadaceae bacterium]|nr:hypothetical protein [Hyphomonadaceae bacterium]
MNGGGILQRIRAVGLLLALFALTFRAMLPPGFMLDTSGSQIVMTMCGGGEAVLDIATGEVNHGTDHSPVRPDVSQHCPFALMGAPTLVEPTSTAQPPIYAPPIRTGAVVAEATGVHDATGPPLPARGPPLTA